MLDHPFIRLRLVELIVVVGALAVLAAIVAPAILAAREAARRS
jgi:Tfp pilus assembly protein PilE